MLWGWLCKQQMVWGVNRSGRVGWYRCGEWWFDPDGEADRDNDFLRLALLWSYITVKSSATVRSNSCWSVFGVCDSAE